jgi:hypothetical protein
MTQSDGTQKSLKITAVSAADAARILSSAYGRRVTEEQVREVVEAGDLARPDGTFSLIDYVAFLAGEVTGGHAD